MVQIPLVCSVVDNTRAVYLVRRFGFESQQRLRYGPSFARLALRCCVVIGNNFVDFNWASSLAGKTSDLHSEDRWFESSLVHVPLKHIW